MDGQKQWGLLYQDALRPTAQLDAANQVAAKGRVERAHQTLQDRLVKELRLNGINDRAAGNAFIELFREDYNRRFARTPKNARDAHRPLLPQDELRRAFSWQEQRRLTGDLVLHYKRVLYVVVLTPVSDRARGKLVMYAKTPMAPCISSTVAWSCPQKPMRRTPASIQARSSRISC